MYGALSTLIQLIVWGTIKTPHTIVYVALSEFNRYIIVYGALSKPLYNFMGRALSKPLYNCMGHYQNPYTIVWGTNKTLIQLALSKHIIYTLYNCTGNYQNIIYNCTGNYQNPIELNKTPIQPSYNSSTRFRYCPYMAITYCMRHYQNPHTSACMENCMGYYRSTIQLYAKAAFWISSATFDWNSDTEGPVWCSDRSRPTRGDPLRPTWYVGGVRHCRPLHPPTTG